VIPSVSVTFGPTSGFQLKSPDTMRSGFGGGAGGSGGGGQYELKTQPDLLVLNGSADDVKAAIGLLEKVDVKQPQILIEAKIVDVKNDATKDLGVEWDWSGFFTSVGQLNTANDKGHETIVDEETRVATLQPVDSRIVTRTVQLGPAQLTAALKLMVTSGKANLLANPKVAVVAGKPANIFIGDEVKYVINIQTTTTGQNITTETANVGIQLRVLGLVGGENDITLNIHPEVSVINAWRSFGNGVQLPEIGRRFTDSTIRIKSGETVVIGGLIKEEEILSMSKVPFLGDLPFFGELFKSRSKAKSKSEVVVFITASILPDA